MATKDLRHYFQPRNYSLRSVSQTTIDSVNKELSSIRQNDGLKSRGEYIKISAKDCAVIGEYAAKNGILAAIRHFKRNGRFQNLKEPAFVGGKISIVKNCWSSQAESVPVFQWKYLNCHKNAVEDLYYLEVNSRKK